MAKKFCGNRTGNRLKQKLLCDKHNFGITNYVALEGLRTGSSFLLKIIMPGLPKARLACGTGAWPQHSVYRQVGSIRVIDGCLQCPLPGRERIFRGALARQAAGTTDEASRQPLMPAPCPYRIFKCDSHLARSSRLALPRSQCNMSFRRPARNHKEHIQNEKPDGNVVEQPCLGQARPKLIGGPEQKGRCQQNRLRYLLESATAQQLKNQISQRNHRQRKCGEELVASRRKQLRLGILNEQQQNGSECQ